METAAHPTRLRVHHIRGAIMPRVAPSCVVPACGIELIQLIGAIAGDPESATEIEGRVAMI